MKNFILGIIVTLIIGSWITLAIVGVISIKAAILVPVGIIIGLGIALWLLGMWWNSYMSDELLLLEIERLRQMLEIASVDNRIYLLAHHL